MSIALWAGRAVRWMVVATIALGGVSGIARAQAPINSNVALQPSKGGLIIRQQLRYTEADFSTAMGELDIEVASSITTIVYGVTDRFTLIVNSPYVLSRQIDNTTSGIGTSDSGFADVGLLSKLRVYRNDFGPTDTARFDLIGGVELPSGDDGLSSDSVDPILGGVYTYITDRHAFNGDATWKFNTGSGAASEDLFRYNLAYLYRLTPETYASRDPWALFGAIEFNGAYETNRDSEVFLSPGIEYVTTRLIVEASVQVPILQDLDARSERDFVVAVGIRFQF